jgi:adenylate cyclase
MKLREKTLLLISILLACLVAGLSISLSIILLNSFADLEKKNTRQNVLRVKEALNEEVNSLQRNVKDYSEWDDTYEFIEDGNSAYRQGNLVRSTFENFKINFLLIFNQKGQKVFSKGFDLDESQETSLPPGLEKHLAADSILVRHQDENSAAKGLLLLQDGFYLIAAQPILTSDSTGPVRGSFIMGQKFTEQRLESLKKRTQLELQLIIYSLDELEPEQQQIGSKLEYLQKNNPNEPAIVIEAVDSKLISGYTLLRGIYDDPILLLKVDIPRDIYQQGIKALTYLIVSLLVVGIIFGIATLVLLEKTVLKRLTGLSSDVEKIGTSNDLALRVKATGKDELSSLADTINWMLENLEKSAKEIAVQQQKVEKLLLNILPRKIAEKLTDSQEPIADHFDEVTILFADIVGFTPLSAKLKPIELVNLLNEIFSNFDNFVEKLGLEKIKTIGDAYMVAAGLPTPRPDHAEAIAEMALSMQESMKQFREKHQENVYIRIGINTGVVVAGVIGKRKFIYDLWGDAVNIASRMESSGRPGNIQLTESTYEKIKDKYITEKRGLIPVKGKGEMITYWLKGRKPKEDAVILDRMSLQRVKIN